MAAASPSKSPMTAEEFLTLSLANTSDVGGGTIPRIMSSVNSVPATAPAAPPQQEWKSCCFRLQPQAATFAVQVFFSAFLVFFSAYKLVIIDSPDPLYVSLLTTTVGVWLPSPLHVSPIAATTVQTS